MVGPTPSNSFKHSRRWSHDKLLSRNLRATAKSSVDPRGSYLHSEISHFPSPSSVFFRRPFSTIYSLPRSFYVTVAPFPLSFFSPLFPTHSTFFLLSAAPQPRHKTWWHFSPFLRSTFEARAGNNTATNQPAFPDLIASRWTLNRACGMEASIIGRSHERVATFTAWRIRTMSLKIGNGNEANARQGTSFLARDFTSATIIYVSF